MPPDSIAGTYKEDGILLSHVRHSQCLKEVPAAPSVLLLASWQPLWLVFVSSNLDGPPILVTAVPYFLHLMMTVFHCPCCISFLEILSKPWLLSLNNEIPLMLWELCADHGLCWKMWLQKCEEKPPRTAELHLGLIRGPLIDDRCVLTPV